MAAAKSAVVRTGSHPVTAQTIQSAAAMAEPAAATATFGGAAIAAAVLALAGGGAGVAALTNHGGPPAKPRVHLVSSAAAATHGELRAGRQHRQIGNTVASVASTSSKLGLGAGSGAVAAARRDGPSRSWHGHRWFERVEAREPRIELRLWVRVDGPLSPVSTATGIPTPTLAVARLGADHRGGAAKNLGSDGPPRRLKTVTSGTKSSGDRVGVEHAEARRVDGQEGGQRRDLNHSEPAEPPGPVIKKVLNPVIPVGPGPSGERTTPCGILATFGAWRSLVARTVRVGEVPGSNPGAPMCQNPCYGGGFAFRTCDRPRANPDGSVSLVVTPLYRPESAACIASAS